jgi:preprotein translocase subunit SecA
VLVVTISIEKNEKLSAMLKRSGVPHQLLNAKQHAREAEIVAQAGQPGSVTIATNMAGRGTDIVLGPGVREKGGLHIIGTERHESRRIDNQLRGRAGRQGDPGSSCFYISLQDDLMRIFGSDRIGGWLEKLGLQEGEMIEHPWITKALERAQRTVEGHNFDIRKHLLEYDDVMNQQRKVIYAERQKVLEGEDMHEHLLSWVDDIADADLEPLTPEKTYPENLDWDAIAVFGRQYQVALRADGDDVEALSTAILKERFAQAIAAHIQAKETEFGPEVMRQLERALVLQIVDQAWKEHLYNMDKLKEGIGLRAYGQKDPLQEYKREGRDMFMDMIAEIKREILQLLIKIQGYREPQRISRIKPPQWVESREDVFAAPMPQSPVPAPAANHPAGFGGAPAPRDLSQAIPTGGVATQPVTRQAPKVGRNDLCPCGSGKKYKKCHGS